MRKCVLKCISIILILIVVISSFTSYVEAIEVKKINEMETVTYKLADKYLDKMGTEISRDWEHDSNTEAKVSNVIATMVAVVRIVAMAIAIIMLLVIAMKYMYAAPGEKADIKKHAIPYVIGAFVMFAFAGILKLIQQFSSSIQVQ